MEKLTKRQFLKACIALGLPFPLQSADAKQDSNQNPNPNQNQNPNQGNSKKVVSDTVIIIGSGAAGLAAGYLLNQAGIDFQILEAAANYGGRMKRTTKFTDFPIALGAEWIHGDRSEFDSIINDASVEVTVQTLASSLQDEYGYFEEGELTVKTFADAMKDQTLPENHDLNFVDATWFDFFDKYITPSVRSRIRFNTQIINVDYASNTIVLKDSKGQKFKADKVIVTAPLKILQEGDIRFSPALPNDKLMAIKQANIWGGIKIFIEFSEKFYPTLLESVDSNTRLGQRSYFDASYGHNTSANILGLFAVGKQAEQYQSKSKGEVLDLILKELDPMFEGIPSKTYVKHIVQDWNEEPFIRSAYLADVSPRNIPHTLSKSVANKLFFAGEAYSRSGDWGGVHNAAESAKNVVEEILG